jgi:hypothetical protein
MPEREMAALLEAIEAAKKADAAGISASDDGDDDAE